jgi:hypothetical protein
MTISGGALSCHWVRESANAQVTILHGVISIAQGSYHKSPGIPSSPLLDLLPSSVATQSMVLKRQISAGGHNWASDCVGGADQSVLWNDS